MSLFMALGALSARPDLIVRLPLSRTVRLSPRSSRRWAQKGAKIRIPYYGEHLRMNVTGLVGLRTGQFYALEFTHTNSEVFQVFLNHANQDVKLERPRNIVICDNATWHNKEDFGLGFLRTAVFAALSSGLIPFRNQLVA